MKMPFVSRCLGVVLAALLLGCVASERKAARRIDRTLEAVQQANSLLAADPELGRYPIQLDGFRGALRLKGEVATEAQKARAAKLVWAVPGVRSVENKLRVGGTMAAGAQEP